MILTAYNPLTDNLEKTYLSNAYAVGTTTFVAKNTNGFANNQRIMIGEMGREKTEILTINTVNADGVTFTTTAASRFPHSVDDAVYILRYDQIKFYRSVAGISGAYTALATVGMDVDNANMETTYDDTTGLASYYYKVSYYASTAAIESTLSDPIPGSGYSRRQVGTVINDLLEEVGDLGLDYTSIPQLLSWVNEMNDDLSSQSKRPYRFLRKNPSWQLSTVAGVNRISLPSDMTFIDFIQYAYLFAGQSTNPEIDIIDQAEMNYLLARNQFATLNDDQLQAVAIDPATNELILYPTPLTSQTNVLTIYGWTNFTEVTGLSATIQTPNPRIYKLFLAMKYWRVRAIKDTKFQSLSNAYGADYNTEVVKLQRSNRIDKGTPTGMKPDRNRGTLRNDVIYY